MIDVVKMYKNLNEKKYDTDNLTEFEKDAYESLDIVDNPKRHQLFTTAWDIAHANGLYEVYLYMVKLVDLIE